MLFSFAVRSVYVESCSMFTRGGVYRVVKEALGGNFAKLSVSALMFDYILTGPISGVSAGQYIVGLLNELLGVGVTHVAAVVASVRRARWPPHERNRRPVCRCCDDLRDGRYPQAHAAPFLDIP